MPLEFLCSCRPWYCHRYFFKRKKIEKGVDFLLIVGVSMFLGTNFYRISETIEEIKEDIITDFIKLNVGGVLRVVKGYA